MNLITENTTQEEHLKEYRTYPSTFEGGLDEKPFYESRILPIFYEVPLGSKVLDVGCNDGTFIQMLRDKRGCDVSGVDVSETALELSKKKGLNVQLTQGDTLPFPDATFDVVTLMEVLVHVLDPIKTLSEIKRVLKPSGFLLGSTPHKNLERNIWDDKRMHRRYYDEEELHADLSKTFENNFLRILKGGQFALSVAQSFLGDLPCEILFKSGSRGTLGWDAALEDRSILRAWFGPTQTVGTTYFRMTGFADKMQKRGAQTFYSPFDTKNQDDCRDWQRKIRWKHVQNEFDHILKAADLSVWQITASWDVLAFFRCIKDLFKKPFVTEIDDWLFDLPSYNIAASPYQPNSDFEKIAFKQIELSDAIVCSTQYIKDGLASLFPDKPIHVIRNSLDFEIWDHLTPDPTFEPKKEGMIRLGYTGCGNHHGDLELLIKPLFALLKEFPNLEFYYPLQRDKEDDQNNVEFMKKMDHPRIKCVVTWVPILEFPHFVKSWDLDIGVAPLRDNHFNRAKSNLRWLEYSALKCPTVASDIYPFKNSIRNKKDGIVVKNSPSAWYEALKTLIVDERKRTTIGHKAYERVKRDFNMDSVALEYMGVLQAIKNESLRASSRNWPASLRPEQRSVVSLNSHHPH